MQHLQKEIVAVKVSGGKALRGSVVDASNELIVLFAENQFVYLPFDHIHSLHIDRDNENNIQYPSEIPTFISQANQELTLKNILTLAKGNHIEITVAKNEPLHGVITSIMDDYFIFESPIYRTMFVSNRHLKCLIPHLKQLPYGMNESEFQHLTKVSHPSVQNTFASQIAALKNHLVILNLGKDFSHIGRIKNINNQMIALEDGKSNLIYFNLSHVQILQLV